MESVRKRLARHDRIGLDTSIFIYHLEGNRKYLPVTQAILAGVEAGEFQAVMSVVALMELTVHPWQTGRPEVARQYEALLVNFPNLQIPDVTRDVARRAAQLRSTHKLKAADAIQVATALVHRATAFVTNDLQLQRLSNVLEIVLIEGYASQ